MSKICPNCKREIDENVKFCPFCAAFTGETSQEKKKSPVGAIIGGAAGVLALGAASLAVFVFDIFGMYGEKTETLYGTGDKLFIQSVTPVCIDGKWGYADKSGSTTLKPQYSAAYAFNEDTNDVAPVAVDGKFGYIKKDGEFVAQPQYSFAGSFSDKGLAKVTDENGNVGFVDSRGRKAFDGRMFSYASDMNDSGYAFAYTLMMPELEGRGYYDIIYSLLSSDGKVTELANGTGISAIYDDKYIGFRQAESNETTLDFTREYAVFSADGTQLTDYYDRIVKSGKLLIVCDGIDDDSKLYKAKLLKADTLEQVGGEYLCGSDIKSYDSGAVLLKRDDKGFIRDVLLCDNANEIYRCSTGSHIVSGFDMSGYACVYEKGKYCGYTASGKQFESDNQFGSFNCGLAPYYDNAKIGYINTNGEKVTDAKFDGASGYYADGYAYVKSGTEYSVIDMNGNTVIGRLSYASDKLMFADTVHSWYDPEDFEKFDGENMFQGDFYYVGNNADMNNSIFGRSNIKPLTERMVVKSRNPDVDIAFDYRRTDSGKLGNDGYILTHEINKSTHLLMSPDGKVNKEDEMNNANVICIDSAPVIRYCDDTTTYLADIFGNKYVVSGYNLINSNGCTALDLRNGNRVARQILIYDNSFMPSVDIHSQTSMNITDLGDLLYVKNISNGNEENNNAIIDKWNGRTLYTIYNADFISDYFISKPDVYKEIDDDYIVDETDMYTVYTVSTSYGVTIGTYPYVKAYGDRVLCFDYDKYYLYDRYANLLGEYENRPKISAYNGNTVVKNDDGTYTCYDRDMNVLLTTKYDIQPMENGYMAYLTAENGKTGFIGKDGKVALEARYEFVSAMSPDGYFVSKTYINNKNGYDYNGYTPELIGVTVNDLHGKAEMEGISGMCNAGNSAANGYSPLDFYAGAVYYESTPKITQNIENYIFVADDGERLYYTDRYGNRHYEEYYVSNSVDQSYMSPCITEGKAVTLSVLMYDETGKNSETVNYYLNLDGTPFVKGDRTLDRLQSFGYIIGDGNEDGRYNIYGAHGKILLSNIETEKSADGIGINRNGDKLAVWDMNGVRIFDLITQEQVFEKEDGRFSFIAENLISYPDGNADKTVCVNLDNGKTYTYEGRVSFINLDSYRNKKAVFPLRLVKYGNRNNGGATDYDNGYDCLSVYSLDEDMEESYVNTYTAGEGKSVFRLGSGDGTEMYGITDTYNKSGKRTWTFINVMLDRQITVDGVISVNQNKYPDKPCFIIGTENDDGSVTTYELDAETMELSVQ
jgi:hypothetical protein